MFPTIWTPADHSEKLLTALNIAHSLFSFFPAVESFPNFNLAQHNLVILQINNRIFSITKTKVHYLFEQKEANFSSQNAFANSLLAASMMTVSILWSKFSEKQEYIFNLCKKAYLEENTDAEVPVVKKSMYQKKFNSFWLVTSWKLPQQGLGLITTRK